MVYDEAKRQLIYKGEVAIKQGDIATRSPQALARADRRTAARLESMMAGRAGGGGAGRPQGAGPARHLHPRDETMVLVGEQRGAAGPAAAGARAVP